MERKVATGHRTPVNKSTKKLGLRRSALKRPSTTTSTPPGNESTPHLPKRQSLAVTPIVLSDCSSSSITTPLQDLGAPRLSVSTGQYKLTLSRRVRENLKKKRLDFLSKSSATNTEDCKENIQENFSSSYFVDCKNPSNLTKLSEVIAAPEKPMVFKGETGSNMKGGASDSDEKVNQLKNAIMIWKKAFKRALDDLSSKLNIDAEETLKKLHIPDEMTKYLEDNEL